MNWDINNQTIKISSMWAIINIGGAANARHHHGNSDISGAYYVRAPHKCGDIVFYDPRPAPVYSHPNIKAPNFLNAISWSQPSGHGIPCLSISVGLIKGLGILRIVHFAER